VNSYLTQGLADSRLDRWFTGPEPTFNVEDLIDDHGAEELASVLQRAKEAASDLQQVAWPPVRALVVTHFSSTLTIIFTL